MSVQHVTDVTERLCCAGLCCALPVPHSVVLCIMTSHYQHRSASPSERRVGSFRHRFQLAAAISTLALTLVLPMKLLMTCTRMGVVCVACPQSALQTQGVTTVRPYHGQPRRVNGASLEHSKVYAKPPAGVYSSPDTFKLHL